MSRDDFGVAGLGIPDNDGTLEALGLEGLRKGLQFGLVHGGAGLVSHRVEGAGVKVCDFRH